MLPILYQNGQNFVMSFSKNFLSEHVINKLKGQLNSISKSKKESYIAYYRRIRVLIRNVDPKMSEEKQILFIRSGLKSDSRF